MSRIVVIGGHGKVALLLTPILAELGHSVTSVIRNPDHAADVEAAGATPHVADVEMLDTDGIAEVLAGHDAVVWSAGAGGETPSAPGPWTRTRRSARWRPRDRPACGATSC